MRTTGPPVTIEQQLREMNEALLISLTEQHELTEQAQQAEAALRASQEQLRRNAETFSKLVEQSPFGIYVVDSEFRIAQVSSGAQPAFRSVKPLIGRDFCEAMRILWPEPFASEAIGIFRHTLQTGEPYIAPSLTERRHDVDVVESYEWQVHRVTLADGQYGVVCYFFDATRLRQAEHALRDSEARFRTLFELGPVAVYSCDASGVIQQFNRRAAELWGRAPALGDTDERFCGSFRMIRPDGTVLAHEQCPMAEVLAGTIPHARDAEVSIERPDGSRITVVVNIRPLKNEQGVITGAINCFYDITQRKHMEQALRDSEARFRMLADNMAQLAWTCDKLGNCTWYNQRWLDYTGLSFDDMRGWDWKKVHHPDHVDRVVKSVERSRDTGAPWEDTFPLRGKDGEYRWFLSRAVPIRDESGNIARWFGTNTDITEQRRANAEADEANRAKDMFLATLSHEMRTPLSAILGWMHILQGGTAGGCTDEEINEGLDVVERNARAMVQLMDDVLDVSRIVSGKVRLEVRPCELSDIIRAGIDVVRSAAQAKDITLSAELDPAASASSCDASRMQQVVWNLLSNAIKFTPKGGRVHVKLAREASDLHIQVSDSGQGIGAELLPHVFDRFRQADSSTRRRYGGLGLGLSIVKHLVELHGGTVQVESGGEGRGTTFSVYLPIRAVRVDESGDDPDADESELASTIGLPIVRLDALRVLVVDDDPDARRLLIKVLRDAGAVVMSAANATEALAAIAESNPEVLVSDLGMPDQDGFDLIREVRRHGHHAKDLPAVALSAFAHKNDRRRALLAGFQMHVPKPADPHDLTAAIASLAGRTGPAA